MRTCRSEVTFAGRQSHPFRYPPHSLRRRRLVLRREPPQLLPLPPFILPPLSPFLHLLRPLMRHLKRPPLLVQPPLLLPLLLPPPHLAWLPSLPLLRRPPRLAPLRSPQPPLMRQRDPLPRQSHGRRLRLKMRSTVLAATAVVAAAAATS